MLLPTQERGSREGGLRPLGSAQEQLGHSDPHSRAIFAPPNCTKSSTEQGYASGFAQSVGTNLTPSLRARMTKLFLRGPLSATQRVRTHDIVAAVPTHPH